MMNHMVSQLTRFNLHIRVKGRRNVQGSEHVPVFYFQSGTEISAAARSVHCRKYFLPPTHTKGFLQYHTARPGPARHGSDQARSGLTSPARLFAHTNVFCTHSLRSIVPYGPALPGPGPPRPVLITERHHTARPGTERNGTAQARPGPS